MGLDIGSISLSLAFPLEQSTFSDKAYKGTFLDESSTASEYKA